MPADPASARLRALLVLTGAAALLWLCALLGLGGWTGEVAAIDVPPWTLPEHAATAAAVDSEDTWMVIGERPLFTPDRKPQPFMIDAGDTGNASAADFTLTGVLITPALEVAILTPAAGGEAVRVRRGEEFPGRHGWQLHELAPRHVLFQTPGGLVRFDLRGSDEATALPTSPRTGNPP